MSEEKVKYYEGIYMVRVLSDRPQGEVSVPEDLAVVLGHCYSGDCVGDLVFGKVEEVTPIHMAELLAAAGSTPEFFQLPDMAHLVEDLLDSSSDAGCSGDLVVVTRSALNPLLESAGLGNRTYDTDEDEEEEDLPTCILTGAEGEDPEDCTTHRHEE